MRLGDTERMTLAMSITLRRLLWMCDQGCLAASLLRKSNPSSILTLKCAKRTQTRCVNCRKVVQSDGITKGDGHTVSSPFSNSNPRLSNGRIPQSPRGFCRIRRQIRER